MGYREFGQQFFQHVFTLAFVINNNFKNRLNVFFDGQCAEDRSFLRQVANSHAGTAVHRQIGNVMSVNVDITVVRSNQPGNAIETGGFAGAVRPQ